MRGAVNTKRVCDLEFFETKSGARIAYLPLMREDTTRPLIVWGHGWRLDHHAMEGLAQTVGPRASHWLIDFPGFGSSPMPESVWGTSDYADALAELIASRAGGQRVIVAGHSFGGRVAIDLAARYPQHVAGLILLASAGLPRKRSLPQRVHHWSKVYTFKTLRHLAPLLGLSVDELRKKFGSADYRAAGPMREIFLRVIREDLAEKARRIQSPVMLVYGANDAETPPEVGERLSKLIPSATLTILPGQDHNSILSNAAPVVGKYIISFLERV